MRIKALVAAELAEKLPTPETIESSETARLPAELSDGAQGNFTDDFGKS